MRDSASAMATAFGNNNFQRSTKLGFDILREIGIHGRIQGGPTPSSALAVAVFPCMNLGTADLPTSVVTELTTGAFGVRSILASDDEAVLSQDGDWIIQPPTGKTWNDIATLESRNGITGQVAHTFLALGHGFSTNNFVASGDQLLSPTNDAFDWAVIPTATFGNPYVVVGQCTVESGFLQHNIASNPNAEIFGFVQPTQCPDPAPQSLSFVGRMVRMLTPEPAFAAAALLRTSAGTGGGAKPAFSPFVIMKTDQVNTSAFSVWPDVKKNTVNQPFTPTPVLNPKTVGGVTFKQASVLAYLKGVVNNGTPSNICYNWGYSDDTGKIDFPFAKPTKAGGYNIIGVNMGTVATDKATGQSVPLISAGKTALSPAFQVKNAAAPTLCPVFDGTTYFTNILNPTAQKIPFDPNNAATFPPNFDDPNVPPPQ